MLIKTIYIYFSNLLAINRWICFALSFYLVAISKSKKNKCNFERPNKENNESLTKWDFRV